MGVARRGVRTWFATRSDHAGCWYRGVRRSSVRVRVIDSDGFLGIARAVGSPESLVGVSNVEGERWRDVAMR